MASEKLYTCPKCGAEISIDENRHKAFCTYCGNEILLRNENEYIYHHIDEAEVTRAETERMVKLHEMQEKSDKEKQKMLVDEENKSRRIYIYISEAIILVITIIIRFFIHIINGGQTYFYYYLQYVLIMDVVCFLVSISYDLFRFYNQYTNNISKNEGSD